MNRLIRIALTLFVSATILIFLVLQRLERAREIGGTSEGGDELNQLARSELQMAYIGMGFVALLLAAGLVLIGMAIARSRKKPDPHG